MSDVKKSLRKAGRGLGVQFLRRLTWNVNCFVTAITAPIINGIYPPCSGLGMIWTLTLWCDPVISVWFIGPPPPREIQATRGSRR